MSLHTHAANRNPLPVLASLAALATLATNIILPAFPDIGRTLAMSTQELAILLSAFFIPFAVGQLVVGPLSDRFGRQALVLGGLLLLIIGSALCALATDLKWLIVGRIIQGLGACAPSVLARSIARDLFEGPDLSRALSFIMIAMAMAPGFSPLLGGLLSSLLGWRSTFGLVALLTLLFGLLYWTRLGETHPHSARRAVSVATTVSSYLRLLADRRFIAPAIGAAMAIGSLFAFFAATPAVLMDGLGLSAIELGYFFAITVFVVFAAGAVAPRLESLWGAQIAAIVGCAAALSGAITLLNGPLELLRFGIAISLFLFGIGLLNPLCTALALQPFAAQAGAASALLGFLQMSAATLAITYMATSTGAAHQLLGSTLVTGITLALLALLLPEKAPVPVS